MYTRALLASRAVVPSLFEQKSGALHQRLKLKEQVVSGKKEDQMQFSVFYMRAIVLPGMDRLLE
jgi:hypothetical protein